MASIFSKIAAGEIPSYKCAESDKFYAFLDISPIGKGHTLVIPRKEVDYIFDMEDEDLAEFEVFAKKVAKAIKAAFPCKKVAQVVLGLEVPPGISCFSQRIDRDLHHSRIHFISEICVITIVSYPELHVWSLQKQNCTVTIT